MFALTNTLSLWFFVGVAMEMDSPFKQAMFAIDSKARVVCGLKREENGMTVNRNITQKKTCRRLFNVT